MPAPTMNPTELKKPPACTDEERRAFERLVREGFDGSDDGLPERIRAARWLAFHYQDGATPVAIAGLKAPGRQYRNDVFEKAGAAVAAADYELELGWVFVVPAHRGKHLGRTLCRRLLARAPESAVFATTRPDNHPMIAILRVLGFATAGKPYRHVRRNEQLTLFLRPSDA